MLAQSPLANILLSLFVNKVAPTAINPLESISSKQNLNHIQSAQEKGIRKSDRYKKEDRG